MDIAADLGEVALLLDEMRFETPLKQVPDAAVAEIEVSRVTAVEQMHPHRQVGLRGFKKKVVVVCHEHEGVQPPTVDFHRSLQPIQPPLAIRVIANDSAALVATRHHVVQSPRQLDSQRSCHAPKLPPFRFRVNT
jgi:hypothetical protein